MEDKWTDGQTDEPNSRKHNEKDIQEKNIDRLINRRTYVQTGSLGRRIDERMKG
jgi:hypothetical protein